MADDVARLVEKVRARLMPDGGPCPDLLGLAGDSAYYVPARLFREVCGGMPAREAARAFASLGALRKNGRGGFKHRRAMPGGRIVRVYVLEAEKLGLPPAPTASGDWQGP